VEVIDDFAPMVDKMVDEIVSLCLCLLMSCWWDKLCVEVNVHYCNSIEELIKSLAK